MNARIYTLKTNIQRQAEVHNRLSTILSKPDEMKEFNRWITPWTIIVAIFLLGFFIGVAGACGDESLDTIIGQINEKTL